MVFAAPSSAQDFRVCLFHSELNRKAPGLLYRDILARETSVVEAADRIARGQCDVLGLMGFDYDYHGVALTAFSEVVVETGGPTYRDGFALRPNVGWPSFVDLDMDGRLGTPRDAQSYGRFSGEGGVAILSRLPILKTEVKDFSSTLWKDLPWAVLPETPEGPFFSSEALAVQRLSTTGHWDVPIAANGQVVRLLMYHASPPVFDGPEDRNGLRNADETLFWLHYINAHKPKSFVILGAANLDPIKSDGRREAIQSLLISEHLHDPFQTKSRQDSLTVDWSDIDLGRLRTDFILPSVDLTVIASGTIWPEADADKESRHALIWVELSQTPIEDPGKLETSGASK